MLPKMLHFGIEVYIINKLKVDTSYIESFYFVLQFNNCKGEKGFEK